MGLRIDEDDKVKNAHITYLVNVNTQKKKTSTFNQTTRVHSVNRTQDKTVSKCRYKGKRLPRIKVHEKAQLHNEVHYKRQYKYLHNFYCFF